MNKRFLLLLHVISIAMVIALAVVIIIFLTKKSGSEKPIEEVSERAVALFENEKAEKSPERILKKYYGLDANDYEGMVLYFPISNMDAEEMLIIKMADESQADEIRAAMEERNATQSSVFDGYAPEQFDLCSNYIIDVQGNYIIYVVHKDAARIDEAFREGL